MPKFTVMGEPIDLARALEVARKAAEAANAAALIHFQQGVKVERKPDRSPVTAADRASEHAVLSVIDEAFPAHSILAEESGAKAGNPRFRWLIDPIDGTRGFTRGGQFWGSLIALEVDGQVEVGTMALPALGDVYFAARGLGCYLNNTKLTVRPASPDVRTCTVSLGELRTLHADPWGPVVHRLIMESESARCYGDLMGVALVLRGVADVWLEAGVAPWDIAPAPILLSEAGALFSNFRGDQDLGHGTAIGAPPGLHAEVLKRFRAAAAESETGNGD